MTQSCQDAEAQRLILQASLDKQKSQQERNRLGQFATPTILARDILTYSLSRLPEATPIRFLDPAIGTGSFYSALVIAAPTERIEAAQGFEIDEHYEAPARKLWAETPLKILHADFTQAKPPTSEYERFNLLVCNPPYVRHHHLVNGEKLRLQEATKSAFGTRISGLAGLYCYFLALSHVWMRPGAVAAWLIPSEFMDVNYGKAVKLYLLNKVTLLRIHRFDPNDVQFQDALVSSAVVLFRNETPPPGNVVELSYGGTLNAPMLSKTVSAEELSREAKWTRFPVADIRQATTGLTLKDFFQVKRGLATGDNKFFILTPEQIDARSLPWEFFRPILPSPRYVSGDEVLADENGNPILDKNYFYSIVDCQRTKSKRSIRHCGAIYKRENLGFPAVIFVKVVSCGTAKRNDPLARLSVLISDEVTPKEESRFASF